jgi:hypothetical protein
MVLGHKKYRRQQMNKETNTPHISTTSVRDSMFLPHIVVNYSIQKFATHSRQALAEERRYRMQTNCVRFTKTLPRSGAKQVTSLHQLGGAATAAGAWSHAIAGRRLRTLSSSCYQTQFRSHDYALYVAPPALALTCTRLFKNMLLKVQIISRSTRALATNSRNRDITNAMLT